MVKSRFDDNLNHHSYILIYSRLEYHHIPDHIKNLIRSIYTDFQTSIITEQFNTAFIKVGRGVLQGDCLSPLLFNMSFNTFIQRIKSEKYSQVGFWKFSENGKPLNPFHWFQFADDAAVISGQENENQLLLNRFTLWCQWAHMIIRVDKCSTFGIKKDLTKSIQYLPKLFINNCLVPRVDIGKSFRYLGRYFDFNMTDEDHKSEIYETLANILKEIDDLPLHPKNKILLYSRYALSKISWHFTVSDISKTWVIEKPDSTVSTYIRKWLELPISATLSNVLLPQNKFGLNVILPSTKFLQCQSVSRKALKLSPNEEIKSLWKDTSCYKNIQYDTYQNTKHVLNSIRQEHEDRLQYNLVSQGSFFSNIIKHSTFSLNSLWSSVQSKLPKNIFNFTIRYINNTLPTRKSILSIIASTLKSVQNSDLYVDLPGYLSPSVITGDELRPDLLITLENKIIYIVELTVGYETNLLNNATRKRHKYEELINDQQNNYEKVIFVNLSISALGVFSKPSLSFMDMLKDLKFDMNCRKYIIRKIINTCVRSSYYVFCKRNQEWNNPEIMSY